MHIVFSSFLTQQKLVFLTLLSIALNGFSTVAPFWSNSQQDHLKVINYTLSRFIQVAQSGNQYESPPSSSGRGAPSNRQPGGSRDSCPVVNIALTPLISATSESSYYTATQQPTFWVYTPYPLNVANPETGSINSVSFRLENSQGEEVYQTIIDSPVEAAGIVGITLPSNAPELELGETYFWYVRVFCNTAEPTGQSITAWGWVQRVEPGAVTPESLWYDRLTEYGNRLQANPNDAEARSHWNELLELVDVEGLVDMPILP